MKSLPFTHFREKLIDRTKQQTVRMWAIPGYMISDEILLRFKHSKTNIEPLFTVIVTELFPLQIKQIDEEIAIRDGFNSLKECIWGLASINGGIYKRANQLKPGFLEHWAFITRWRDIDEKVKPKPKNLDDFMKG